MHPVIVIGDAIIDAVAVGEEPPVPYPGGAALNLAVGLARLGMCVALAARIGLDRHGQYLMRHLREEGIRILNSRNADYTGVATSYRREGEPSFSFTTPMYRRRINFDQTLLEAMERAPAVAINSYSFDDRAQAESLCAALERAPGLRVLDPNPRPRLIASLDAFRTGFALVSARATLVKLSIEDARLLYGRDDDDLAAQFFQHGVEVVIITRGELGASVLTRGGIAESVPATATATPVVDTMGAGDAVLASIIAFILQRGMPGDAVSWRACLALAMDVAAATCRSVGGGFMRPAVTAG